MIAALAGCLAGLDRLDAPFVLAMGMEGARSLAPDGEGAMLVAGEGGVWRVDGQGGTTRVVEGPVEAVTARRHEIYTLYQGRLSWDGGSVDVPGAVDIAIWYDERVRVLTPTALWEVEPATGKLEMLDVALTAARSMTLRPERRMLVVDGDRLIDVGGHWEVPTPPDALVAVVDGSDRVLLVAGHPAQLWRWEGQWRLVAPVLGDAVDLMPGFGPGFPTENLYFADGSGALTYLRLGD